MEVDSRLELVHVASDPELVLRLVSGTVVDVVAEVRMPGVMSRSRILGFFQGNWGATRAEGGCWLFVGV